MLQLEGIPGSFQKDFKPPRWYRMPDTEEDYRRYEADIGDGVLRAIVSQDKAGHFGARLWHISVSHRMRNGEFLRVPSYDEIKHAKYSLLSVDVPMQLIFPKKGIGKKFVDLHPTTLHLWEAESKIDE